MPTYEYSCKKCGRFEIYQRITEEPLQKCPTCGGTVKRLVRGNAFVLYKCDGFHNTDYRSESYKKAAAAEKSDGTFSTSSAGSKADKKADKAS